MPWGLKRYCEEEKISAERWFRVGRVSAKIPTSRKEREKWGTQRSILVLLGKTRGQSGRFPISFVEQLEKVLSVLVFDPSL
jgi:hypothetical protein